MSQWILDCSTTMAWCFSDEASPRADAALDRLKHDEAIVPSLWIYEVQNVLLVGERRGRILAAQTDQFIAHLRTLNIIVERTASPIMQEECLLLARQYQLTAYDAAYLELAVRYGLPLATLDDRLAAAAVRAGVSLICPPKV